MSAHSYIYVTIFYFLNYLFFKKKNFFFFLKMMLTYHISHKKFFSTALYVHGRSGVNHKNLLNRIRPLKNISDHMRKTYFRHNKTKILGI